MFLSTNLEHHNKSGLYREFMNQNCTLKTIPSYGKITNFTLGGDFL